MIRNLKMVLIFALICLSLFFCFNGLIILTDTDHGKIIIRKLPIETQDEEVFSALVYRPFQTQSLNPSPVIILYDYAGRTNLNNLKRIAAAFAKAGYFTLLMLNDTENDSALFATQKLEAGFGYVSSRFYIRTEQIHFVAIYPPFEMGLPKDWIPPIIRRSIFFGTTQLTEKLETSDAHEKSVQRFYLENDGKLTAEETLKIADTTLNWFSEKLPDVPLRPSNLSVQIKNSQLFVLLRWICLYGLVGAIGSFFIFGIIAVRQIFNKKVGNRNE